MIGRALARAVVHGVGFSAGSDLYQDIKRRGVTVPNKLKSKKRKQKERDDRQLRIEQRAWR